MPVAWQVPFTIGLVISVAMLVWSALLFQRAQRARMRAPPAPPDIADRFIWIFLVPALNEEITIADSVERLVAVKLARRRIVVIDDGSTDGTPEILAGIHHPDLVVLRRDPPNARQGKAAALNYAYRKIVEMIGYVDRSEVIVVIIDADGRLDAQAPRYAASHFVDPEVAGVQALVRIYNRWHLLAWMQHNEFQVYGYLFQTGRNGWATAGMGGNGQFNRLSALDWIADDRGPWRDKLTEDQDLGLRLLGCGLQGRQELRASVDQQGLSAMRPLFRQRTRWSQGNLQAISLIREVWRSPFCFGARLELVVYLLMPALAGARRLRAHDRRDLRDKRRPAAVAQRPGRAAAAGLSARLRRHGSGDGRGARHRRAGRVGARLPAGTRLRGLHVDAVAGAAALDGAAAHRAQRVGEDRTRGDHARRRRVTAGAWRLVAWPKWTWTGRRSNDATSRLRGEATRRRRLMRTCARWQRRSKS